MRYELLLQSSEPGAPYAAERVTAAFRARGVTLGEDGAGTWKLKNGEIELRALREGGLYIATELRVPLSDKTELMREVLAEASTVAEEAQVRLFDPQLTRGVGIKDDGAVSDQYFRTAKYAGEMLGVSEAIGASFAPPEAGLKPGTKILLGLVGVCVLLYLIADRLIAR